MDNRKDFLADRNPDLTKEMKDKMWIELHELKPNTDELILVSLADGTVECAIYNGLTWNHPYNNAHVFEDVVAWQPLPDPYVVKED